MRKEHGKYQLSEESSIFLSKHSPAYLGSIIGFLSHDWHSNHYRKLTDIVRNGGALNGDGDNTKPNDEAWVPFARSMAPMMAPSAHFIAELLDAGSGKHAKVLDVAAGHGIFGVTFARIIPMPTLPLSIGQPFWKLPRKTPISMVFPVVTPYAREALFRQILARTTITFF